MVDGGQDTDRRHGRLGAAVKLQSLWVVERDGEPVCCDDMNVDFTSFTEKSEAESFTEEGDAVVEFRRVESALK